MRTYTVLQEQVIEAARAKIKHEPWFRGICLTDLPNDHEIERQGFQETVDHIVAETEYHDATGFQLRTDEANG